MILNKIQEDNIGNPEEKISENRSALYYSKHNASTIKSLLNCKKTLSVHGTNAWVVALACYKNSAHAYIFLEKLRQSGQHEILTFDIINDHGKAKPQVNRFDFKRSNIGDWDMDDYSISSSDGDALKDEIELEIDSKNLQNYKKMPLQWTPTKNEKVNCTTWCIHHIQNVQDDDNKITESRVFSKIPRLAVNQNTPENQPIYQRWLSKIGF